MLLNQVPIWLGEHFCNVVFTLALLYWVECWKKKKKKLKYIVVVEMHMLTWIGGVQEIGALISRSKIDGITL